MQIPIRRPRYTVATIAAGERCQMQCGFFVIIRALDVDPRVEKHLHHCDNGCTLVRAIVVYRFGDGRHEYGRCISCLTRVVLLPEQMRCLRGYWTATGQHVEVCMQLFQISNCCGSPQTLGVAINPLDRVAIKFSTSHLSRSLHF